LSNESAAKNPGGWWDEAIEGLPEELPIVVGEIFGRQSVVGQAIDTPQQERNECKNYYDM
jgi:hypothetical protein